MRFALQLLIVVLPVTSYGADQDLLGGIWASWEKSEERCPSIEISYKSHVVTGSERQDDKVGIALLGKNGSVYCREDSKTKGKISYTYSSEGLLLPKFAIRALVVNYRDPPQTTATLVDHHDAVTGFGELSQILQLTRPSQIGRATDYTVQPKSNYNGNECLVIQRKHDAGDTNFDVTLFLREDLDYLPVRRVVTSRRRGKEFAHTELEVSYEEIDDLDFPKTWVLRETFFPGTPKTSTRKTSSVRTSIEIGREIPKERFRIELPIGTKLTDVRTDLKSEEVLEGSRAYSLIE